MGVACTRGSPKRSPGMRVPRSVTVGAVSSVNARAPRMGSWLGPHQRHRGTCSMIAWSRWEASASNILRVVLVNTAWWRWVVNSCSWSSPTVLEFNLFTRRTMSRAVTWLALGREKRGRPAGGCPTWSEPGTR